MKIIYFTTAQTEKDYRTFINKWRIALNASNQNFHNKMIRCLAINNEVHVISIRPFSLSNMKVVKLGKETIKDGNITWHYLERSGGKLFRTLTIVPQVKKILKNLDLKDAIFVTDTINPSVSRAVEGALKKYNRPVIGLCTDSPSNISGTKRSYTLYLLDKTSKYQGYVALTEGLNYLFNPDGKPSYIVEGLVEEKTFPKTNELKPEYFFFGGALMERYGVYQLIEAYKILNLKNTDLYICGHHLDKNMYREATSGYPRIRFLGLLPVNKVMEYEHDAIACINPRPFTEDLDRFSIPSKTLEYMSMGVPVISVKNTILMEKFPKEVIWVESANESDIVHAMKQLLNMSYEERDALAEKAKNRVLELYSLENVAKNIQPFLEQFVK